jgi:formyl-CoA transferase
VHGITKVPARRAPALGEHNAEVLQQLGFGKSEIDALQASGAVPTPKAPAQAAVG